MHSGDICTDDRFDIIDNAKKRLLEATNIDSSPDEMAVLDNILFRMWQMGWLPKINNNVNHPNHYKTGKYECLDVMMETQGKDAVLNFCLCNAFKYLYRNKNKNGLEDIEKAIWYLNEYVKLYKS